MNKPFLTDELKNQEFMMLVSVCPELMKAFVEGIYGEIPFVGESPVNLIPEAGRW